MSKENIVNNQIHIEQIKAHKLPFPYRQFLAKHKSRSLSLYNVLFDKIKTIIKKINIPFVGREDFFDVPTIIVDFIIVGDNPFASLLLYHKILKEKKDAKLVIYMSDKVDYWGYEYLMETEVLKTLSDIYKLKFESIDELIIYILNDIKKRKQMLFLLDERYNIKYSEFDQHMENFYLHFTNEKLTSKKIDSYIQIQSDIKKIIKDSILKKAMDIGVFHKFFWKVHNKDTNKLSKPIVIANQLILTSMPHGNWIVVDSCQENNSVIFSYENKNLIPCCSAKKIRLSPVDMKDGVIKDLEKLLNE